MKDQKIYGLFGGYVGMALSGEYSYMSKMTQTLNGETSNYSYKSDPEKLEFSFSDGNLQSLNYGINPGLGVEFKKFQLEFTYNMGLNFTSGDESLKNQSFNLIIGYRFERDI